MALADGETSLQAAAPTTTHIDIAFDLAGRVTDDNRRHLIFIVELQDGAPSPGKPPTSAPTKHLKLVDPQVRNARIFIDAGRLHVELRAVRWPGWWSFSLDGADGVFTDNSFSICPPGGRLPSWSRCRRAGRNRKPQKRCRFVLFSILFK